VLLFQFSLFLYSGGRKEKELFVAKCGQCHKSSGSAPLFAPNKYASSQWKRFFKRKKHKRKKDISKIVSPADQKLILKYLVEHAADSSQPEVAGLK